MKAKRKGQSLVPSTPTKSSQSLVTSTPTEPGGTLRQEFRAWRATLPARLERDTLLMPEVIAENVVREAERFLQAELPATFAERLAAKAYYLYPRHTHFRKGLNRRGNGGRETMCMFMRHWTAAWMHKECYALYKKLPSSFAMGQRLPKL